MPKRKPNFAIDVFPKSCKQCKQFMGRDYLHLKRYFFLLFIRALIRFYTVSVVTHASLCGQPQSPDGRTPWKHRRLKNKTEEGIHIYWYCYLHSLGKNIGFPLLKFGNVLQLILMRLPESYNQWSQTFMLYIFYDAFHILQGGFTGPP